MSVAGAKLSTDRFESSTTLMAAKYIGLAERLDLPVISYFCDLPRDEGIRSENSKEQHAMIATIYSLIRQMVGLLDYSSKNYLVLSTERLFPLDGTMRSWPQTLSVFQDLLQCMPNGSFCVIDGFEKLDDRSTDLPLEEVLGSLRHSRMQVLLTTTGRSRCSPC